jgi:hypothetical protein
VVETNDFQPKRLALFITEVLEANDSFVDRHGDLVTASVSKTQQSETKDRLVVPGRLPGFSRLLGPTMSGDTVYQRAARTF